MQSNRYTVSEEIFNSVTHGIGVLLSVAGLAVLVLTAVNRGSMRALACYTVYGISLFILYLFSTLYHSVVSEKAKQKLRFMDHASIYLLIAGSYTPISLLYLQGGTGWALFAIVWVLAIIGVVLTIIGIEKTKKVSMGLYFLMGWLVVLALKPMLQMVPRGLLIMLLIGGLFYTLGIIFYAVKKIPYHHGIWHLFVLGGSISHFVGFLLF